MMKLLVQGKPYIYTHTCSSGEEGRILSREELEAFALQSLIKSYELKNIKVSRHDADFNSGADFSFIKFGRTICCKVKYVENQDEIYEDIRKMHSDRNAYNPQMKEGFEKHGTIPRIYYAELKCISSHDGSPIAGGDYEITYHPIQWLHSEKRTNVANISEIELIRGYAVAWANGGEVFFDQYLSPYFTADSELSFEAITSKTEYIDHFLSLHKKWWEQGVKIETELISDDNSDENGVLIKVNCIATGFVTLTISDFRISHAHTQKVPDAYSQWNPEISLYQTHGDHHAPFLTDKELLHFLRSEVSTGIPKHRIDTDVRLDNDRDIATTVFSVELGKDSDVIKYLCLLAYDPQDNKNLLMSAYPYLPGKPTTVKILDVLEWDNRIEATVKCRYTNEEGDECDFHFFATDYYFNKELYSLGNEVEIALAASSGNAHVPSKGFSFEGQKAVDFLAKLGKEPTFDENGNVEPVNFSTEKLIAFLPHDEKCPDEAEFQSPTKNTLISKYYFNDTTPIQSCLICLNADSQLWIPLFHNDINHVVGNPIAGNLWISGRMSNPGAEDKASHISQVAKGMDRDELALKFIERIESCLFRPYHDVTFLLSDFPNTQIWPGYLLYCAELGNSEGTNLYNRLYVSRPPEYFKPIVHPNGCVEKPIEENDHPDRRTSASQEDTLPPLLGRIGFKHHDVNAIWEAFLIYYSENFLPTRGRYALNKKTYFFNHKKIEMFPTLRKHNISIGDLFPYIYSVGKGNTSGYVILHYWNHNMGLTREVYSYIHNEGKVMFNLDAKYVIVECEPEFLFRDGK